MVSRKVDVHPSLGKAKRIFEYALIGMMFVVITMSIIDLGKTIFDTIVASSFFVIDISEILRILSLFLIVLISLELLDTLIAYLDEDVIHAEIVLEVALIAAARKIILIEADHTNPITIFALGFLLIASAGSFFLVKRFGCAKKSPA